MGVTSLNPGAPAHMGESGISWEGTILFRVGDGSLGRSLHVLASADGKIRDCKTRGIIPSKNLFNFTRNKLFH